MATQLTPAQAASIQASIASIQSGINSVAASQGVSLQANSSGGYTAVPSGGGGSSTPTTAAYTASNAAKAAEIQKQINQLQTQIENAKAAGYGPGGQYAGQDIPDHILAGDYDTGNEQLNEMLAEMQKVMNANINAGQVVNPNIELTPAQIKQFTDLASAQISPYYKSQLEAIKTDLLKSIENLQKQYEITKKGTEAEFKQSLGSTRESMAGSGTTFSGQRGQTEQQMVSAQNRALDLNALSLEGQLGSQYRETEQKIGSTNMPTNYPSFQTAQATTSGRGGFTPGRTLEFFTPGSVMGQIPQQQKEAELLRLSKLKQAARENRSLDFYL